MLPTLVPHTPYAKPAYGKMSEDEARGLKPNAYICQDSQPATRLTVSHIEGNHVHIKEGEPVSISDVAQGYSHYVPVFRADTIERAPFAQWGIRPLTNQW
jgi:hypothetical protein